MFFHLRRCFSSTVFHSKEKWQKNVWCRWAVENVFLFLRKLPHEHVKLLHEKKKKRREGEKKKDGKRFKIRRKCRASVARCNPMMFLVLIWQRNSFTKIDGSSFCELWQVSAGVKNSGSVDKFVTQSCLTSLRRKIFSVHRQLSTNLVTFCGGKKCLRGERDGDEVKKDVVDVAARDKTHIRREFFKFLSPMKSDLARRGKTERENERGNFRVSLKTSKKS